MAKKSKNANRAVAGLPAGFTNFAVGGGFGAWWDHNKQKTLTGKIVGFDSYMAEREENGRIKKEKRGIMRVTDDKGNTFNVGESAALKELFMPANIKALRGKQIFIRFLGQDKFKKGKQTRKINKFQVAVK